MGLHVRRCDTYGDVEPGTLLKEGSRPSDGGNFPSPGLYSLSNERAYQNYHTSR